MKTSFAAAACLLVFTSSAFAQSGDTPMDLGPRVTKHKAKRMHRDRSNGGGTPVVVGSDVKATAEGEVVVPPMSIIDVKVPPATTPSKSMPAPSPAKP